MIVVVSSVDRLCHPSHHSRPPPTAHRVGPRVDEQRWGSTLRKSRGVCTCRLTAAPLPAQPRLLGKSKLCA